MSGDSSSSSCGSNYTSSSSCGSSYTSGSSCGSNYTNAWQSFDCSRSPSYSYAYSVCQGAIHNYECNQTSINQCYHQHHSGCGSGSENVLQVAMQDAMKMGAGVQGDV